MAESSRAVLAALLSSGLLLGANRVEIKEKQEPFDLSTILSNSMSPSRRSVSFSTDIERDFRTLPRRKAKSRLTERQEKASGSRTGEVMYERGQQFLMRKQEKTEEFFRSTYSFKPQIDPNSKKLTRGSIRKPLYSLPTPKPVPISSLESKPISSKTVNLTAFLQRNYVKPQQRKSAQRDLSLEKDRNKEEKECTFQPSLDKNSKKMIVFLMQKRSEGLYERAVKLREKQSKRKEETVKARIEKELKECTFAPKLNQSSPIRYRKQVTIERLSIHSGSSSPSPD